MSSHERPVSQVSAGTRGFLFCDLRGYTAFIERSGDAAAAELLATYRAMVRGVIAAHEGAEIRTEGDSLYVVFPAASGAVEAGLGIVAGAAGASTKERPIAVGVGVHAGETVATTEGLVGGAVNIAARVCAKAQAGEVLVTDTVRALTRTYLPYRYTSLGTQSLKGIAGGIPLYRVEAVPSSGRARLRRQLGARRGRLALLAGAVVVLLVALGGFYAANRPADCLSLPADTKDVVARIDPGRGCVVAVYEVGRRPGDVVTTKDAVWVANVDDWTLTRIDPATGASDVTGLGGSPVAIAAGGLGEVTVLLLNDKEVGASRVADKLAAIDPRSDTMARGMIELPNENPIIRLPAGYVGVTTIGGQAWISNQRGYVIYVPGVRKIILPAAASSGTAGPGGTSSPGSGNTGTSSIDAGGGAVWIANDTEPTAYSLDGPSGRAKESRLDGAGGSTSIDATDTVVWFGRTDGRVTRLDPIHRGVTSFATGGQVRDIAAGADVVWVTDESARVVRRVATDTGSVVTIPVGGQPGDIAIGPDGSVWVTLQAP